MQLDLWSGGDPPGLDRALGAPVPTLTAYLNDARRPGGAVIVLTDIPWTKLCESWILCRP